MPIGKVCIYRLLYVILLFVRLRISLPRIKLAASNFAGRFIGVPDNESPILVKFDPSAAQNRTNRLACEGQWMFQLVTLWRGYQVRHVDVGLAYVDIHQSLKTDILVFIIILLQTKCSCFVEIHDVHCDIVCLLAKLFVVMWDLLAGKVTRHMKLMTVLMISHVSSVLSFVSSLIHYFTQLSAV